MPKVLVVDDSISVRKALERILMSRDMSVSAAESAELALRAVREDVPDLIIADVVMPGMDGFELCQNLKALPATQNVPVVLISGIVNPTVEERARQVGASGVVKKPFTPADLFPTLERALNLAPASRNVTAPAPSPAAPAPAPAAAGRPSTQVIREHLGSLLERSDIPAVVIFNAQGKKLLGVGSPLELNPAALKTLLAAASYLGKDMQEGLQHLVLEYGSKNLVISHLSGQLYLVLLLTDINSLSVTKYLLKRHLPDLRSLLGVQNRKTPS